MLTAFILMGVCIGCAATKAEPVGEELLKSFRLVSGGKTFHGKIDQENHTVIFKGIEYGKSVTNVMVRLADGADISPRPSDFVGKWPERQVFKVSKEDRSADYEVILSDLKTDTHNGKVVLGYIMLWYMNRFDDICWDKITHILPTFVYVKGDATLDSKFMDQYIKQIKEGADAHGVKTIVSFMSNTTQGGPAHEFSNAIKTAESREKLADAMWAYVRDNGLDGLDIDYEEYKAGDDFNGDLPNLLEFCKTLCGKKHENEIMTCAIAGAWLSYGKEWHKNFDYIGIMSYDYNVSGGKPAQHAPWDLFLRDINHCHDTDGMPLSKLCPGIPFYGNTWDKTFLTNTSADHRTIAFWEIVDHYKKDYPDVTERDQIGSTLYNGKELVRRKCRYVMDEGLGGIMVWQLFHDAKDDADKLLPVIGDELNINAAE